MNKVTEMAKLAAKGGFNLFLGVSLSTVISALGVILLVRLLTPTQYALYAIALMPPALISLFRDWGINFAMIKHLAQYKSENKIAEMKSVIASGLFFESALGILLSFASFFLAGFLAINVFHRPEIEPFVRIASIIILAEALLTAAQSTFIGFERMDLNSLTMICLSVFKSFLAPLLVFLGYGTFGAILGYTTASIITSMLGIIIVYLIFYKNFHGKNHYEPSFSTIFRTMFRYGLPLSVSAILGGVLVQFYNFMMVINCTDLMIGNYQAAMNFLVLITFFQIPVTTVLFPAFSKLNPEKEMETLRIVFQSSVKYASLLIVPPTTVIMVLSKPLLFTVFGEKYSYAPLFLSLTAIIYLYTVLGNLTLGNFLSGQGKTTLIMELTLITLAIGFPLGFLLIPKFGITGLIAATLVSKLPNMAAGLWWARKHFGVTVDWSSSTKILAASATAGVITHLILSQLSSQDWISLIVGGTTFLITYLTTISLIRAVNISDINNLRQMLVELGPLSYLFNIPLDFIEKLTIISKKAQPRNKHR
jgi:O-antigen/teichoic acid export membrane protein